MKLRAIILVLSILVLLSTTAGGLLHYNSAREAAFLEASRQAASRAAIISGQFSGLLSQNLRPARTLAGMPELRVALRQPDPEKLERANRLLDHFQATLGVDVCYLMDGRGQTVATSNRNDPDSFLGHNFGFRPYFQKAMQGSATTYMALGTASGKRGVYYSHPVPGDGQAPAGVVVIKASVAPMEKEIIRTYEGTVVVTDPHGVIFLSSREDWLFHTLWRLNRDQQAEIARSMQFGEGPWEWIGFELQGEHRGTDDQGEEYLIQQMPIQDYPGWQVIHLRSQRSITDTSVDPLVRTTGAVIFVLCLLMGVAVLVLYRTATNEIAKRRAVEKELRESKDRYRSLYHNTPALLHSIDSTGRLVSVSDYWMEDLGYAREEVEGRRLTDFMTPESKRYAEEVVFPSFFRTGMCKDIPYRFVKKNGQIIDVLLSAIAERDNGGSIVRSLAVFVDISERKRAEEQLQAAKEQLSLHSRNLERQVRERTREFTGILQHTPALVYMVDRDGRFVLVNSKYEELFGLGSDQVLGLPVDQVVPAEVVQGLHRNDRRVLDEGRPLRVEERVPVGGSQHTYLSVKFPLLDESGRVSRVCGISMDITDLKKAQDQLRRLSGNIMASQEKERTSIARELHDELGQVLTALRMDTVWLRERLNGTGDAKGTARAQSMCELIDRTISDVRHIAMRLRPSVLDDLGLIDALEWFTTDFEKRTGIACIFSHSGVPTVSNTIATAAYRIAQEALTNVARHSRATHVDVLLQAQNGVLTLAVMDNGCGFDILSLADAQELGVAGMRERASLVGGTLDILSSPNRGTKVYFKLPLGAHSEDET